MANELIVNIDKIHTTIMGIDRILDMTRTAVNITGDAVCTTIVAYQNNDFNTDVFNDKECKDELFA